jgi:branched-chain amino acid transport system permease protein
VSTTAATVAAPVDTVSKKRALTWVDQLGLVFVGLALIWLVANFVKAPTSSSRLLVFGLSNGALYALIALGYTMVYGIIELINFAHGDLFMIGSVVSAIFLEEWFGQKSSSGGSWILMVVAMLMAMAVCALINVTVEFLAYRRLRNAPKLAPLITAVGVSFIFQNIGIRLNGSAPKSRNPVLPKNSIKIFGVEIAVKALLVIAITVPLLIALTYLVQKTKTGKAMRATAQDRDASALMGINVNRIITITFAIGGALAGAAGMLALQTFGTTRYDSGFRLGLFAFTAAVLGGVGNLKGAVVGAVLIGVIQSLNDGAPYGLGQEWTQTVTFAILIMVIIFKPEGIFGTRTQEKV